MSFTKCSHRKYKKIQVDESNLVTLKYVLKRYLERMQPQHTLYFHYNIYTTDVIMINSNYQTGATLSDYYRFNFERKH